MPLGVRPGVGGDEHGLLHVLDPGRPSAAASKASTGSRSQQTGGAKTLLRHWSYAIGSGLLLRGGVAQVHLQTSGPAPPAER